MLVCEECKKEIGQEEEEGLQFCLECRGKVRFACIDCKELIARQARVQQRCRTCYMIHKYGPEYWKKWTKPTRSKGRPRGWKPPKPAEGSGCEICGLQKRLVKDHAHGICSHSPKKVCKKCFRGWLCVSCNVLLGHAQENPGVLENAIKYLIDKS